MLQAEDFFDLARSEAADLFASDQYVWVTIAHLAEKVDQLLGGKRIILGEVKPGAYISDKPIYIGREAVVYPGAYIDGPAYIGEGVVIRHGAYIRNNVIMLPGSILGHASEAKNSLFMKKAVAAHFNYVGDSIIGSGVNLGAGTKLSNLTIVSEKDRQTGQRPTIRITIEGKEFDTGMAKFGAVLGDGVQIGCNAVLNPGCLVGKNSLIYANLSLKKGYYPPDSIIKLRQVSEISQRRS